MLDVIGFATEAAGAPIVRGGASKLLTAFESLIADQGGSVRTNADVERIVLNEQGRAGGVRLDRRQHHHGDARRDLFGRSRPALRSPPARSDAPARCRSGTLARYRYGKGNLQIHYALSSRRRAGKRTTSVASRSCISLRASMACRAPPTNVSAACCRRCRRSVSGSRPRSIRPAPHPARPFSGFSCRKPRVCSRAMRRARSRRPPDGRWSDEVRERFADRVEAILASHIDGLRDSVIARRVYSPADLETMNINLVRRRSLRRLLRPRSVLPLAPVQDLGQSSYAHCRALPHRRIDPPGTRAWRRLRVPARSETGVRSLASACASYCRRPPYNKRSER